MKYYVYVLKSQSYGVLYIGHTNNLDIRLKEHNLGKSRYTKGRMPWDLLYKEEYNTRSEAMKREIFLKSGQGRNLLKGIISKA